LTIGALSGDGHGLPVRHRGDYVRDSGGTRMLIDAALELS